MTQSQLPARPDLEQLKRQAKELLQGARSHDADALARFRALPGFSPLDDERLARAPLALHDAQSVIARELGFPSWKALREHVEYVTLEAGVAADAFVEAATDGRSDRAEGLLQSHPRIARANLHTALVLGDGEAVESALTRDPNLATAAGGPRGWEPLLYVCHTSLAQRSPERAEGVVRIARRLLALGADPNLRYPWVHHGVRRAVLWGATRVTRVLPLAEVLLEAGADPSDGVTLPLAASGGDTAVLDLLFAHGANVDQPWATDGSHALYAILHWAATPVGVRWLLEHGADADPVFAANGETPLHVVARRWDADTAALLVEHGADVSRRRADGRTPYAVAELNGNRAVADWLLAHGASPELPEVDRLVGACSRGDREAADAMLRARPTLREEIGPEHYVALYQAAERDDVRALEALLACGFDVNRPDDEIGKTALHAAAMEGWPDAVRVLLAHGASVTARDREFNGQPLVWAAEGSMSVKRAGRDHAAVGRLLLDAGSPTDWEAGAEPSEGLLEVLDAWRRTGPGSAG
jgi:ankyrin repeat protein